MPTRSEMTERLEAFKLADAQAPIDISLYGGRARHTIRRGIPSPRR